jgi:hypothetical protein
LKAEENKDVPSVNLKKNGATKTFEQVVRQLKDGHSEGWAGEMDGTEVQLMKSAVNMETSIYRLVHIKH